MAHILTNSFMVEQLSENKLIKEASQMCNSTTFDFSFKKILVLSHNLGCLNFKLLWVVSFVQSTNIFHQGEQYNNSFTQNLNGNRVDILQPFNLTRRDVVISLRKLVIFGMDFISNHE